MSKVISTNTGMLQIVDVSMYHGVCSPDNIIEDYRLQEEQEEGYFEQFNLKSVEDYWDRFSFDKYSQWITEQAKSFIDNRVIDEVKALDLGITDIQVKKIWSPREYNFDTDRLMFDVIVEDDFVDRLVSKLDSVATKELEDYLRENFSSRSGFVSFTPNNVTDLKQSILDWDDRAISVFLQWLFYKELPVYNWLDEHYVMSEWYSHIQETYCDFYSFLN
jgi:hypothetical protein